MPPPPPSRQESDTFSTPPSIAAAIQPRWATCSYATPSTSAVTQSRPLLHTAGMYSTSGIDMIGILSKVANRPNPVIDLGPVDLSSSFLVVDAQRTDMPIIYASESFERLTGYSSYEIMGKNCRFLQCNYCVQT